MGRLGRCILNGLTVLSLALCVGVVAWWVRSVRTEDVIMVDGAGGSSVQWRLSSDAGAVVLLRVEGPIAFARPQDRRWWSQPADPRPRWWPAGDRAWGLLGASVHRGDFNSGPPAPGRTSIPYRAVVVPLWMAAALALVLPLVRAARWRQRHRRRGRPAHACPTCGYDLRATPERCPECGRVADAA